MNTALTYLYRDADNYKARETVVLTGAPRPGDFDVIQSALDDGCFFIPSQVGLPDLQEQLQQYDSPDILDADGVNPADHVWHELELPEAIEETAAAADPTLPPFAELVEAFRNVTWDETASIPGR